MKTPAAALALPATLLIAPLILPSGLATADSFTPVRLSITAAPVARLGARLRVKVVVHADAGVLDTAQGPVRVGVKLAGECGGNYETTSGPVLVNRYLKPQPATGKAYSATAIGSGRPRAFGSRTLCTFLEDAVGRVYANDESNQVDVSARCTAAGLRYDVASRALKRAQRQLRRARQPTARRRLNHLVAARRRTLARDRRRGVAACGRGVPL